MRRAHLSTAARGSSWCRCNERQNFYEALGVAKTWTRRFKTLPHPPVQALRKEACVEFPSPRALTRARTPSSPHTRVRHVSVRNVFVSIIFLDRRNTFLHVHEARVSSCRRTFLVRRCSTCTRRRRRDSSSSNLPVYREPFRHVCARNAVLQVRMSTLQLLESAPRGFLDPHIFSDVSAEGRWAARAFANDDVQTASLGVWAAAWVNFDPGHVPLEEMRKKERKKGGGKLGLRDKNTSDGRALRRTRWTEM